MIAKVVCVFYNRYDVNDVRSCIIHLRILSSLPSDRTRTYCLDLKQRVHIERISCLNGHIVAVFALELFMFGRRVTTSLVYTYVHVYI